MVKLRGYVTQIISPDDQKNYMPKYKTPFLGDKHMVVIEREDFPKGYIKRVIYRLVHRNEKTCWVLSFDDINFKKGDLIEVNCKAYYERTNLYLAKEAINISAKITKWLWET